MGQVIRTATGEEFQVEWCGVASMDGVLRFYIPDGDIVTLTAVFADPKNFPITHLYDGEVVNTYTGYNQFFGTLKDFIGGVTVQIAKG